MRSSHPSLVRNRSSSESRDGVSAMFDVAIPSSSKSLRRTGKSAAKNSSEKTASRSETGLADWSMTARGASGSFTSSGAGAPSKAIPCSSTKKHGPPEHSVIVIFRSSEEIETVRGKRKEMRTVRKMGNCASNSRSSVRFRKRATSKVSFGKIPSDFPERKPSTTAETPASGTAFVGAIAFLSTRKTTTRGTCSRG